MEKKTWILLSFLTASWSLSAQTNMGERVINNTKSKVEQRTEQKIDNTIDKALDKLEDGIENGFKKEKGDKSDSNPPSGSKPVPVKASGQTGNGYDPVVTSTDQQGNTDYSAYKNFDFIPGENVLFLDDFKDGATKRWGAYDESLMEVVAHDNRNWLEVKSDGFFPLNLKTLPDHFTLEFDVYVPSGVSGTLGIRLLDASQADALGDPYLDNGTVISISPVTQMPKTGLMSYEKKINNDIVSPMNEYPFYSLQPELGNHYGRISISRVGDKISLWINKEKLLDNISMLDVSRKYVLAFHLQSYFLEENRIYITNVKLATGKLQPKSELAAGKKFVTQNIYFDVNSDVIKPNSYTILREIAAAIKELNGKVSITGHTDSDGSETDNLVLSQKRAASVKRALVNEFGLNPDMLITDGKGESEPLNNNATPAEKAQNRRVVFEKVQ